MKIDSFYDAVIIGGGPAGTATSYFLARAGVKVLLVESATFPRYHIGESLLPASIPILDRMHLLGELNKHFVRKPGGKWFVGSGEWRGDFSTHHENCSFTGVDYAYMVERSKFDRILLDNSIQAGVSVAQPEKVESVLEEDDRVVGVRLGLSKKDVRSDMIFDCSGRSTFLANKFSLKINTVLNKQSVYSYFHGNFKDNELKNGWFVGLMIPNGWIWAIPLSENKVSIGIVMENDNEESSSYNEKFNSILNEFNFLDRVLEPNYRQIESVRFTKNIGYSTTKFYGKGWTTVGDAAFFIDPCFSSGVHMALSSGELAAVSYINSIQSREVQESTFFESYEKKMREYELSASYMVRHFYNVSSHKRLQMFSSSNRENFLQKDFNTFVGGDFGFSKEFAKECYDNSYRVLQMLNNHPEEELSYFSF